ncbi:MAG: drug/metabolite transporter (DMT)-like permease [Arenicella sp.]|jgi:drug/metabolite transporter (DMT)-like permease
MAIENFGEVFALVCAIMWACAVVLFKHVGESMSANTLNLVKNLLGLSLLLPTALVLEGLSLPSLTNLEWLILIASGYLGIAVADTWYLQALRNLGAGRTAIVASLYSPFVVILSIAFLGERLALWQWLGFVMVLAGILVVVYQRSYQSVDREALIKGILLAAGAVFLTASGVVAMKPILANSGFFWIVSLRMLAGVVGMLIFIALRGQLSNTYQTISKGQHRWGYIVLASVIGSYLAMLFWLGAFKYADASVASVLNETANIFIVIMAWLFLKEELSKRKIVGVSLTFAGVLVFLGIIA